MRRMRENSTQCPSLAQAGRSGLLLVAVCPKVRESQDQAGSAVREGAIMYELWQCITRIVIGEGGSKTEIIVNQSNRELLVELIKKAIK